MGEIKKLKVITAYIVLLNFIYNNIILGQNLISNPSFSDVKEKLDSNRQYFILPDESSDLKNWYLPGYINYKPMTESISQLYGATDYNTSRDKDLLIKNKYYTNGDQLFENNMGFMRMHIEYRYPVTIIQQKLSAPLSKGKYCMKFKYKFIGNKSERRKKVNLDFAVTKTNLKEYYTSDMNVPKNLIQIQFSDSLWYLDINTPWQQKCFSFEAKGDEKYFTIGTLNVEKYNHSWAEYFLDDIELYSAENNDCFCEKVKKDLTLKYQKEFPMNKEISNDTLIMFTPINNWSPGIITPPAKLALEEFIAFMQRHQNMKLKLIVHNTSNNLKQNPHNYQEFLRYFLFFNIPENRISVQSGLCSGFTNIYCGVGAEYVKIGFVFYE